MPDGLVFYLTVLFSEQLTLLRAPVEGNAFAQPQDSQRRRDVARHDAMDDFRREHREAQRPRRAAFSGVTISRPSPAPQSGAKTPTARKVICIRAESVLNLV